MFSISFHILLKTRVPGYLCCLFSNAANFKLFSFLPVFSVLGSQSQRTGTLKQEDELKFTFWHSNYCSHIWATYLHSETSDIF